MMIPAEYYTGEGGYGGMPELKGIHKPVCFGKCLRVQPICIDIQKQVWQYHGYGSANLVAVYDNGYPVYHAFDMVELERYGDIFSDGITQIILYQSRDEFFIADSDNGGFRLSYSPHGLILCDVDAPSYSYTPLPEIYR